MSAEDVEAKLEEWQLHLAVVASLYRYQIKHGKCFLHDQPATAMSWREEAIEDIVNGTAPSAENPDEMMPALKPTKFPTNSEIMAQQLSLRCPKIHDHQPLV